MSTHPTKSVRQQLVDAINTKYRKQLEVEHVDFGTPSVNPNPDSPFNTVMEISGVEGQPYEFTTVLQFTRLAMEDVFFGRSRTFGGVITHTHDLVEAVAQRVGLPVTGEDILGHPIESSVFPQSLLLSADPRSMLLHGQVVLELTGL